MTTPNSSTPLDTLSFDASAPGGGADIATIWAAINARVCGVLGSVAHGRQRHEDGSVSFSAPVEEWIMGDPLEDVAQDVMTLAVEWHAAEPSEWRGDDGPRNHEPIEFARRATAYALHKLRDILEHGPGVWIQSKAGHNRTVALDGAPEPTATPNLAERLETIESLMGAVAHLDAEERAVLERHLAWCEGRHDFVERRTSVSDDGVYHLVDEVAPTQCGPTRRYAGTCPACGSVSPIVDRWRAPKQSAVAGRIDDVLETAIRVRHAVVVGSAV